MAARTSSGETRWQRAVAEARRAGRVGGGGDVALATTADGLVEGPTSDTALIETALDRLDAGGGDGAAWPRVAGRRHVHFITDGARRARRSTPASSCTRCSSRRRTSAITAFGARPAPSATATGEAYLEVANYATGRSRCA